jgi:hypothetical protein
VADFLSPRIIQLHSIDSTIRSLVIDTKDTKREFSRFLLLGRGDQIIVKYDNRDFYESLVEELENDELSGIMFDTGQQEMTVETAIDRHGRNLRLNVDFSTSIELIASHFDTESVRRLRELKEMKVDILRVISSSESLKIESEDWLDKMIWEFVEIDRSYFTLLEFVSTDIAARFIGSCQNFLDLLNSSIWISLGRRFIHPISPPRSNHQLLCTGSSSSG